MSTVVNQTAFDQKNICSCHTESRSAHDQTLTCTQSFAPDVAAFRPIEKGEKKHQRIVLPSIITGDILGGILLQIWKVTTKRPMNSESRVSPMRLALTEQPLGPGEECTMETAYH